METIKVDILNPKAKTNLKNLEDLNLIRIKSNKTKSELRDLLKKLRINQKESLSQEDITLEVEQVRKSGNLGNNIPYSLHNQSFMLRTET
jgi:hypothetical protein